MKKVFYILAAASLCLVSCSKEITKADIEADFAEKQPLPTVSFQGAGEYDAVLGAYLIDVNYSGVNGLSGLSMGVLVSTDPTFTDSDFIPVFESEDGTYSVEIPGEELETNYMVAVAACSSGTAYSNVISYDFPKGLPWYTKVPGRYTASGVVGATGKKYDMDVVIVADEKDPENVVYVCNLDPYFASYGFVADKGFNIFMAKIDEKYHLATVPGGQPVGYEEVQLVGFDAKTLEEAEGYDDIYISLGSRCKVATILNAFGPTDAEGLYEAYDGTIDLARKK